MKFIYIIFGWFLGILSTFVIDFIKNKNKRNELTNGILVELNDIRYRLACNVFLVASKSGTLNSEIALWLKKVFGEYKDTYDDKKLFDAIEHLATLSDEEIETEFSTLRIVTPPDMSNRFNEISLPFLNSRLGDLSLLDTKTQQNILDIKARLDLLNEEIRFYMYCFQKTWEISETENYDRVVSNSDISRAGIGRWSRQVADKISILINKESSGYITNMKRIINKNLYNRGIKLWAYIKKTTVAR